MKKNKLIYLAAVTMLSLTLMAGCSNERKENEAAYRTAGITAMESGDYGEAVTAFDKALAQCVGKIGPDELDICYYKAAAQYANGDIKDAISTYTAMIEYNDKEADAYYLRGCVFLKQGNTDKAIQDFKQAVEYKNDSYELYVGIYENLSGYDMAEKGEEYLNKAFSIKGNSADDLAWRGRIYYYLGQYDNALTELNAALGKNSIIANLYLAQVYEAQGDLDNAKVYYGNYLNSGTTDSVAMNSLGEMEMKKGNYSDALVYLEKGMAMEGAVNKREMMQNLIICYENLFDFNSAWEVAQEYVQAYPDDESANREYIFLKNRTGEGVWETTEEEKATEQETATEQTEETETTEATEETEPAEQAETTNETGVTNETDATKGTDAINKADITNETDEAGDENAKEEVLPSTEEQQPSEASLEDSKSEVEDSNGSGQ